MASKQAHLATGWPAGLTAAVIVAHAQASFHGRMGAALAIAAAIAAMAGSTAPDWLEVAWWSPRRRLWIAHRTVTHWGVGWGILLLFSYRALDTVPWSAVTFGFACGGMTHLLADWPNPLGVPWLYTRHSLNWWNSGRCDLLIVALAWCAALAVADKLRFQGRHLAWLWHHLAGFVY